jgi:hypothetical protein
VVEGFALFGGILGLWGLLRRLGGKASTCPSCEAKTLIPDKDGYFWRCVPCGAQFMYFRGGFVRSVQDAPSGDEAVPTARLRVKVDRDKVDE